MKKSIIAITLALSAVTAFAEDANISLIVSSGSTMTQGMAMVLANKMLDQGDKVSILLCDKAGDLALKSNSGQALKPANATPGQMMDGAMKKGATVSVCALYIPNSGNTPDMFKEGVSSAKPDAMAKQLAENNRKVMSF
jgi:predicted peroxiredoxin